MSTEVDNIMKVREDPLVLRAVLESLVAKKDNLVKCLEAAENEIQRYRTQRDELSVKKQFGSRIPVENREHRVYAGHACISTNRVFLRSKEWNVGEIFTCPECKQEWERIANGDYVWSKVYR